MDQVSPRFIYLDLKNVEVIGFLYFFYLVLTTQELQPIDKAVFRSYEKYNITFGEEFLEVCLKAMASSNILIYPFATDAVPESAFMPGIITRIDEIENKNEYKMTEPGPGIYQKQISDLS